VGPSELSELSGYLLRASGCGRTLEVLKSIISWILNLDKSDKFKAPPPTESELKLRSILRYKKIPFKHRRLST
jgi:hypothetical protein